MHFLAVSLFFPLVLVTQATHPSGELGQSPLSESVYVFTVTSDAPIDQIKASLDVIGGPRHSFRVIGENTYHFVVASNSTTALRHLTFPSGSRVTQYPVAHLDENVKIYGVESGFEENDTDDALPDTVIAYLEVDYDFPKGTPVKQFDLMMSGLEKEMKGMHNKTQLLVYVPIAYYPRKVIGFSVVDGNALQRIIKKVQDVFGGLGIMITKINHVVKSRCRCERLSA